MFVLARKILKIYTMLAIILGFQGYGLWGASGGEAPTKKRSNEMAVAGFDDGAAEGCRVATRTATETASALVFNTGDLVETLAESLDTRELARAARTNSAFAAVLPKRYAELEAPTARLWCI